MCGILAKTGTCSKTGPFPLPHLNSMLMRLSTTVFNCVVYLTFLLFLRAALKLIETSHLSFSIAPFNALGLFSCVQFEISACNTRNRVQFYFPRHTTAYGHNHSFHRILRSTDISLCRNCCLALWSLIRSIHYS